LSSLETRPVIGKRRKVELNDERHLNDLHEPDSLPHLCLPLRSDERMRQHPIADCLRAMVKCRGDIQKHEDGCKRAAEIMNGGRYRAAVR
jgi:hypothetical protein